MAAIESREPTREPGDASDSRDEAPEPPVQLLLGAIGVGLLASGVVAAFVQEDGVTTAALLSAGFAMVFVGYLGATSQRSGSGNSRPS